MKSKFNVQNSLKVIREIEQDGIEMGVLTDGTAYLSQSGLARLCGVDEAAIRRIGTEWQEELSKERGKKILNSLEDPANWIERDSLFLKINNKRGIQNAYTAEICRAILEYYAFEAKPERETAKKNYRLLTRKSIEAFIYVQVGFNPLAKNDGWLLVQERMKICNDSTPKGYFSVFKENTDILISLAIEGLPCTDETIADISIGQTWGRHWTTIKLFNKFGMRVQYEHSYPDCFRQSESNPQLSWAYPNEALPEFRKWMTEIYLPEKFPAYMKTKAKKLQMPISTRDLIIEKVQPKELPESPF